MVAWKRLSIDWLQNQIGRDRLNFIETCSNTLGFPLDVSNKRHLGNVADAFLDEKILNNATNRLNLFQHQTSEVLRDALDASSLKYNKEDSLENLAHLLCRLPWSDSDACRAVCDALQISAKFVPRAEVLVLVEEDFRVGTGWVSDKEIKPFKQLKHYQFDLYFKACEELRNAKARLLLRMPTGTGKTRTACEIASELILEFERKLGRPIRMLWLADRTELLEQATLCFKETWCHLGQTQFKLIKYWGDMRPNLGHQTCSNAVFSSIQKLLRNYDKSIEFNMQADIIVFDEAHRIVADKYSILIEKLLREQGGVLLGLTATPGKGDGDSQPLRDFFFEKSVALQPPQKSNLVLMEWLKAEGFVSEPKYHSIEGITLDLPNKELVCEDFSKAMLDQIGANIERSAKVVKTIRELHKDNKRQIMLFASSVKESLNIVAMLHFLQIEAAHVDAGTGTAARRSAISRFRNGELRVLSNFGVLAEGFDAPKVNTVVIARPTKSLVLYSQMIGRGLRGIKLGGTESCDIYQVADIFRNLPDENGVTQIFARFWDQ